MANGTLLHCPYHIETDASLETPRVHEPKIYKDH